MSRLCFVLLLGLGLSGFGAGASAETKPAKAKPAAGGETVDLDRKLSLYAQPMAFMAFCDIKMSSEAFDATVKAAGIPERSVATVKGRADELMPALKEQYPTTDARIAFCKSARTIPVIKSWTAPAG
jgi:hypothetical protein